MPEIKVQHQCASKDDLVLTDSFGEAIGPMPKQTDSGFFEEGNLISGTWECEPGKLELSLDVTEFCHILEGHWVLKTIPSFITKCTFSMRRMFSSGLP